MCEPLGFWQFKPNQEPDEIILYSFVCFISLPLFASHFVLSGPGDLWSGAEGGALKIWPWEAIEKSFSFTEEERHMAALLVERSYVDPRSQVTVNGFCNLPNSDIRYLLSDNSRAKVWSAGYLSFALWYVFNLTTLF